MGQDKKLAREVEDADNERLVADLANEVPIRQVREFGAAAGRG